MNLGLTLAYTYIQLTALLSLSIDGLVNPRCRPFRCWMADTCSSTPTKLWRGGPCTPRLRLQATGSDLLCWSD